MNESSSSLTALSLQVRPDGIGILTIDQPNSRANTLGQAVLGEFETLLHQIESRTDLRGLIFRSGKPGMFIAGADLRELAAIPPASVLARTVVKKGLDVFSALERLPFPTVAAIDGPCVGGGMELALAFDIRLATTNPRTELGQPEVKIGLIPGWGGTQRLSRLIGPALAAELCCSGDNLKPERARTMGLIFDAVPSERLLEESLRLMQWAQESATWRQIRQRKQQPVGLTEDQLTFLTAVTRAQVLEKTKGQYPAPLAALDAIVKGCNLPLEEALKIETEAFIPLVGGSISRNLIAVFFMTQRLQKDPGVADAAVQARTVQRVGVVGAGIMGAGIAGAHVRKGLPVMLLDSLPQALEKGVAGLTKGMQSRVESGKMAALEMAAALARLSTSGTLNSLADRDVIVEAVIENEAVKVQLFQDLQRIVPADTILASNTSTISITRMARSVVRPENFVGMHFFNPVERMQLVEVIRGEKTSDATTVTLVALAKRIGKTPIVVRDCAGFLVNRVLFPYLNEALVLLEQGADPRALDKTMLTFGLPMGPITLFDVVGLDTSLFAGRVINQAYPDRARSTRILEDLVATGRLGHKSGAGFYSYAKGSRGIDDPILATFLAKYRREQATFPQEELLERMLFPMLTEASRVLMEGVVRVPADVDMGLILGIGFPPFRGGILRWADELGLDQVLDKLKKYEELGPSYQPTEQMIKLAKERREFYTEN